LPGEPRVAQVIHERATLPLVYAETRPRGDLARFRGRKFIAFAGIANPERFFATLESLGATIVEKRIFDDHHRFREAEAGALLDAADRSGALLVTTEKDLVRLGRTSGRCAELARRAEALAIETAIEDHGLDIVRASLRRAVQRQS
jgi:tetraacyldisaccharide 4'-kinase